MGFGFAILFGASIHTYLYFKVVEFEHFKIIPIAITNFKMAVKHYLLLHRRFKLFMNYKIIFVDSYLSKIK